MTCSEAAERQLTPALCCRRADDARKQCWLFLLEVGLPRLPAIGPGDIHLHFQDLPRAAHWWATLLGSVRRCGVQAGRQGLVSRVRPSLFSVVTDHSRHGSQGLSWGMNGQGVLLGDGAAPFRCRATTMSLKTHGKGEASLGRGLPGDIRQGRSWRAPFRGIFHAMHVDLGPAVDPDIMGCRTRRERDTHRFIRSGCDLGRCRGRNG